MSPDELKEHRLAYLEAVVARLVERGEQETVDAAVQARVLTEQAKQLDAIWEEMRALRRLLIGAMVTVTTGAIGLAAVTFVQQGGTS